MNNNDNKKPSALEQLKLILSLVGAVHKKDLNKPNEPEGLLANAILELAERVQASEAKLEALEAKRISFTYEEKDNIRNYLNVVETNDARTVELPYFTFEMLLTILNEYKLLTKDDAMADRISLKIETFRVGSTTFIRANQNNKTNDEK